MSFASFSAIAQMDLFTFSCMFLFRVFKLSSFSFLHNMTFSIYMLFLAFLALFLEFFDLNNMKLFFFSKGIKVIPDTHTSLIKGTAECYLKLELCLFVCCFVLYCIVFVLFFSSISFHWPKLYSLASWMNALQPGNKFHDDPPGLEPGTSSWLILKCQ